MIQNKIPSVVVLVGLPGSGKSFGRADSWSKNVTDSYHYSTDDHIEARCAAAGMTYSEGFKDFVKEATATANAEVTDAIAKRQDVIWDQTNMSAKKRSGILDRFGKIYRKECICILPPFTDEQQIDLDNRLVNRPGKDIPAFVMENMLQSFQLPSENEGFDSVKYFDIYGEAVADRKAFELFGKKE